MKKYNKLVRDRIPEILRKRGIPYKAHVALDDKEYWYKLKEKLLEEAEEFFLGENEFELADIQEVLDAICKYRGIKKRYLNKIKEEKARERGRFDQRIILDAS